MGVIFFVLIKNEYLCCRTRQVPRMYVSMILVPCLRASYQRLADDGICGGLSQLKMVGPQKVGG